MAEGSLIIEDFGEGESEPRRWMLESVFGSFSLSGEEECGWD